MMAAEVSVVIFSDNLLKAIYINDFIMVITQQLNIEIHQC